MNQEARTIYQPSLKAPAVDRKRKKSSHSQNELTNQHSMLSNSSNNSSNSHNTTWMTAVQVIDPRNTFEITKALKTNISRFFKSNKIDIAAQTAHTKEQRPMSVLDNFTPKPKYFQASFYPYEEPSSGEQSPLLPLSSDESDGNQQFRSSDEDDEDYRERRDMRKRNDDFRRKDRNSSSNRDSRSNSSNSSHSSSSSSSNSSSQSSSSSSNSRSSQSHSHRSHNKSHKKSNKSSNRSSSSQSSHSDESPKFKAIKENDANKTPAYEEEYSNITSQENIERSQQKQTQLSLLLGNSASQRKTQASTSAGSAVNSQQKSKGISQEILNSQADENVSGEGKTIESSKKTKKEEKKKNIKDKKKKRERSHSKRNKHSKELSQSKPSKKNHQDSSSKRRQKSKEKQQQPHNSRYQLFKERASVEDVVMNLFESQSHEITASLSQAENHPSIPKLYIEDAQSECDPDALYKIAVTIARRYEYKHKKQRIQNFSVFSIKKQLEDSHNSSNNNNTNGNGSSSSVSVRVLLLEFYKKSTALRVGQALEKLSQHYPYQLDNSKDQHYLPSSLQFKWALDRKKQIEFAQQYFSCVIRNLPEECNESRLKSFIQAKTASSVRILSVENTRLIKNSICSIVRVMSFEEAEHLCVVLNRQLYPSYSSTLRIKCHLHPECCHSRAQAARDDPTKLYFTPKSAAVRCKLIKCRMDSQWMDFDSKTKNQSQKQGISANEAAIGDSDEGLSSNEESFPEYLSLYEGNSDNLRSKLPTPREAIQNILKNTSCLFAGAQPIPPITKDALNPLAGFEAHPSRNMLSSIHSESISQQSSQQQQQQAQIYSNSNSLLASLKLAVTMSNNNKDKEESLKGRKPQDIQGLEVAPGKKIKHESHEDEGNIANKNSMSNSSLRSYPQVSQQIQQQQQQLPQTSGAIIPPPPPHPLLLSSNSSEFIAQQQFGNIGHIPQPQPSAIINNQAQRANSNINPQLSRQVVHPLNPPPPVPPTFVHQHLVQPPLTQQQQQQQPQPQFQQQQQPLLPLPQQQFQQQQHQQQQGFPGRGQQLPNGMGNVMPMQHIINNNPLVQQQQQQQQQHHQQQHLLSKPGIPIPRLPQQQQQQLQQPQQFIQGQGNVSHPQFPQGQVVQPNQSQFSNHQHPQIPQQQQQQQQFIQQQQPLHHPHLPQQPQKPYMAPPPQQYPGTITQPPIGYIQQPQQLSQPQSLVIPQAPPMVPLQPYPSHLISSQQSQHIPTAPEGIPSPTEDYRPMPPAGTTPKTPSLPPSPPSDPPSPE